MARVERLPWLSQCVVPEENVTHCADVGDRDRHSSAAARVVLMSMVKGTQPAQLVRFIEYHLLLGAEHCVLVDNSCGADAAAVDRAVEPYIGAGLVTLHTQYRCKDMRAFKFEPHFRGGSSIVRQLFGMGGVPQDGLVVSLDDDEYVVLSDPSSSLLHLRAEMRARRVCALALTWRVFGAGGHRCQPAGALLERFRWRARTRGEASEEEVLAATREARSRHLNTPYGGKPLYLFGSPSSPVCSTHDCLHCPAGLDNCAPAEGSPEGTAESCARKHNLSSSRVWINHYAFQSAHYWEHKKRRGRTNLLPAREGGVPATYERVHDEEALRLLERRLGALRDTPLRRCVSALFGLRPAPSRLKGGALRKRPLPVVGWPPAGRSAAGWQ